MRMRLFSIVFFICVSLDLMLFLNMRSKLVFSTKRLTTIVTFVRLLSSMGGFMFTQIMFVSKGFATKVTMMFMGPFSIHLELNSKRIFNSLNHESASYGLSNEKFV